LIREPRRRIRAARAACLAPIHGPPLRVFFARVA
jgi:hypothetical protein